MFKLSPITGLESLSVLNVYQTLLIGLQMMPAYITWEAEDFLAAIEAMDFEDQKKVFWDAAKIVPLEKDEVEKLLRYYKDPNGVPISKENIRALNAMQIAEMIVNVCMDIAQMKIDFVTEDEKKKSLISQ